MTSEPDQDPLELPQVLWSVELREDERLLWVGRPMLAGYGKEMLWMYPMCLLFAAGVLVGGWYFYEWAAGAGALGGIKNRGFLAVILLFAISLIVVPPLWPLHLYRSAYALTTQRLIVRQPALLFLWPRIWELKSSQVGAVGLKCIWSWLPEETGDIYWGASPLKIMERVPRAEEVVALIRWALIDPQGPRPSRSQQGANPGTAPDPPA